MDQVAVTAAAALTERFPNRSFRVLWSALGISQFGSAVTSVTIPLIAAVALGASAGQMGLLVVAGILPAFLVKLPAAAWSDALHNRISLLVACDVAQAVVIGLVPALWWFGMLRFVAIVVLVGAASVLGGLYGALSSPLLVEVVPRPHLVSANGRISATRSVADIGGPAVGGALLAVMAAPFVVLADAASFLLSALLLTGIRTVPDSGSAPEERAREESAPARGGLRRTAAGLLRRSGVQAMIAIAFVNGVTESVLVLFVLRDLRIPPSLVGPLLGLGAVGGILGGLLVGRIMDRYGSASTLALGALATIGSLALLPFSVTGWSAAAGAVVFELAGSFGGTLLLATVFGGLQSTAPPDRIARVMALAGSFLQVGTVVGALAGGALGASVGLRATVAAAAALMFVTLVPLLLRWRRRGWSAES
jgi:MFS family permease